MDAFEKGSVCEGVRVVGWRPSRRDELRQSKGGATGVLVFGVGCAWVDS
jgi:hypothetical protein